MAGKIVLINPARRFIANRFGLGYQTPLGLLCIGGPLLDAGYSVKLIDNDLHGWSMERLVQELIDFNAGYVLIGHSSGPTAAHKIAIQTIQAIRKALPDVRIVYGGVFPSYADRSTLYENPEIDVIVRGEGEQTALDLIAAWDAGQTLEDVRGITWRKGREIIVNRSNHPIQNLDAYRPAYELVDWSQYQMFGFKAAAGLQFSRGCPLTCGYCGQWMFWKKWRHRSPENLVEQLTLLAKKYHVQLVWLADENFSADRQVVEQVLKLISAANLNLSMSINMTAADVVRDADLLPLYKAAGVDYIVMGIESFEDKVIEGIQKNNPYAVSKEAVRLLRQNKIISLTNLIYGLEQESWRTLWTKFTQLLKFDSDILNAVYITPHFWTADGKATRPADIIQPDQEKWTYRNQIVATPYLKPFELFLGVKLTEAFFHLRPIALWRLLFAKDKRYLQIMRNSIWVGVKVVLAEIAEFLFDTKFSPIGAMEHIPGSVVKETELPILHM